MKKSLFKMKNYLAIKKIIFILIITGIGQFSIGQNIDIGIFESAIPDKIEVKLRPDFQIDPIETISGILYTIGWDNPTIVITIDYIFPYFVAPQGPPVFDNGIYHQVFAAVPFNPVGITINPGDEILVSSFSYTGGDCAYFEIIEDVWTAANNGDYYCEFLGLDVTGIIYEPIVNLGSEGGFVDGSGTINLGQSTGILTLTDYSGTIIKWQKRLNGSAWVDILGTAGLTTYSEIPFLPGVWEYRAEVQKGTCPVDFADPAVVIVLDATQWTGNTDDDWFILGNWTNGVPDEVLDAIIPVVDPNPYPLLDGNGLCYGLDIASGASLTIQATGTLTAYGDFNNDGQFTIGSTPTGDGSFIDNGTITETGISSVQRYLESERWHYVSSPISDGLSGIYLDIYLKEFNEEDSTWFYIVPVNIPLNPMQGYATWADDDLTGSTTVYYDGSLNTGTLNISLTNHGGAIHNSKGFNFVGNPYPSAVDWEQDIGWTKTNLDASIYLWNPNVGQYGSYTYGDPNSGVNDVDSIIPGGQGFFVHVTDGNATGSLDVNNNARLHHPKAFLKNSENSSTNNYLKLKTYSNLNAYTDETIIQFKDNASDLYDPEYDAYKFEGLNEAPQLYTVATDLVKLSSNSYPDLIENKTVSMGYEVGENGFYTIEVLDMLNFSSTTEIVLEDKKENIFTNLNEQSTYSFYSDSMDETDRFNLHFLLDPVSTIEISENLDIQIFSNNNTVYLKCSDKKQLKGKLSVIDLMGRTIVIEKINTISLFETKIDKNGIFIVLFADELDRKFYREKVYLK